MASIERGKMSKIRTLVTSGSQSCRGSASILFSLNKSFPFHPPLLRDVTMHFRVVDQDFLYSAFRNIVKYIGACRRLEAALSKYRQRQLSFLVSSALPSRKHLWMRELRQLFPALRDLNRLTVNANRVRSLIGAAQSVDGKANQISAQRRGATLTLSVP